MNGEIRRAEPTEDYEILQRVGSGTYGEVYKSRHVRTGAYAAVKVVRLEAGEDFAIIQQEISVLRECVHANIISYYGSYLRRDKLWIVMEYCAGGSLQDIYQLCGPLTELQIAFVCRETLKGLQYLHNCGKIHRDVKAANILLTNSGDVKLADFGVAAQISATLSKRKSVIGSPYWMAPEVVNVQSHGGYGPECDVWAVGITSIELAERQPPFYDMQPMQVLYIMTKPRFKSPQLKEKSIWSSEFHDFVKSCLIKNPKKRPPPSKLLNSNSFVSGALSARLTKELLDRVNGERRRRSSSVENATAIIGDHFSIIKDDNYYSEYNNHINEKLDPPSQSVLKDHPQIAEENLDDDDNASTLNASDVFDQKSPIKGHNFYPQRQKFRTNRSMSLGSRFHMASSLFKSPFRAMEAVKRRQNFASSSSSQPILNFGKDSPSCFGVLPTPQVSMGACFLTVMDSCAINIYCCATWINPASQKQLLIIGAEEGIFTLDINNLASDESLKQIHDRRCTWLYVLPGDVIAALQGKTPYLYRHDILQLVQQEYITQKFTKTINKLPDGLKPRMFLSTVRIPETRNCFQCVVERAVTNGNLYMCCAVPNALLLFQWYAPQSRFIMIKRVELNKLSTVNVSLSNNADHLCYQPFSLIFASEATRSDYPMACVGVSKYTSNFTLALSIEENISNVGGTHNAVFEQNKTEHISESEDLATPDQFYFHVVDFNENSGRLADADFVSTDYVEECSTLGRSQSSHGFKSTQNFRHKVRLNAPVILKQLDRETIFIAHSNEVFITDMDGRQKPTDLMQTHFKFDFKICHALPLNDSVLIFHDNGIQAKSFFRGEVTQDLNDQSKIFSLVGTESLIVLKKRVVNQDEEESIKHTGLCILTGHVSTISQK